MIKHFRVTGAALVLAAMATGCSSPGTITCQEYGEMSSNERVSTERSLLKSHKLDPNNFDNVIGVSDALRNFCGVSFNSGATSNMDMPLDEATDWDSKYW